MNDLEKNLSLLRERQPELAALLLETKRPVHVERCPGRQGVLVHRYRGRLLHSRGDPYREARASVAGLVSAPALVFGFGSGYHLEVLLEEWAAEGLVVVEPDPGLVRAVLEDRDLGHVLAKSTLIVGKAPAEVAAGLPDGKSSWYVHPPSGLAHRRYLEGLRAIQSYHHHRADSLRVLVVGPVYGGSYPVACHVRDALQGLGHQVGFVDLAPFKPGMEEILALDPRGELLRDLEALLGRVVERRVEAFRPDLAILLAQAPVSGKTLEAIRARGVVVAYWFVEDYRRMPYWRRIARSTDAFFVIQRGAREAVRAEGARRVDYLPLAACPAVHRPLQLSPEDVRRYGSAVSFVGAGYPNRRVFLARLAALDLKVWGNEWEGSPPALETRVQEGGRRVGSEEIVKIFNASRVNLNIHSSSYHEGVDPYGDFVNPRTFEIAGCRAFQLVDRRSLLGELFEDGEIVLFEDLRDAREKIEHFLGSDSERLAYAGKGFRRVLREHTYTMRMMELLGVLYEEGLEARRAPRRGVVDPGGLPPELRSYLAGVTDQGVPELEEVVARIRRKQETTWEDRVLLTLMAFKEEAGCAVSSS